MKILFDEPDKTRAFSYIVCVGDQREKVVTVLPFQDLAFNVCENKVYVAMFEKWCEKYLTPRGHHREC